MTHFRGKGCAVGGVDRDADAARNVAGCEIVLGTRRVMEAAAQAGVGRVVHLSSVRAYAHPP